MARLCLHDMKIELLCNQNQPPTLTVAPQAGSRCGGRVRKYISDQVKLCPTGPSIAGECYSSTAYKCVISCGQQSKIVFTKKAMIILSVIMSAETTRR